MSTNSKRIAKNTLLLYIRMLFLMIVNLYTSRVILRILGVEDYGIYNAVGGIVLMLSFLNSALSNGSSRFITFELGKKNQSQLNTIFCTILNAHLFLAGIVVLIAETGGLWFVENKLGLASERYDAALFAYQFSVLTAIATITQVPYTATIIATDDAGNQARKDVQVVVDKKEDPNFYQKIADAALAQIGVHQDCTMLVTNSLKAVGINFHGAPSAYLSLGDLTNDPVPGDICVYQGHVAIYIGNGQAVHGGWNGYTTQIFSVNCSNPLIGYVHVRQ